MATATRLDTNGSVTLDALGNGNVRLAPRGEKWEINRIFVACSTRNKEAQCRIYINHIAPLNSIDGTYSGSSGDTSDTQHYLEDGQALYVAWTGGDPNAVATVTVSGWRSDPEGGFRVIH